ncbi:MAG: tetratricopeptide repeat protein, partial [Gammaproteobacteria bacterium]|nr:tetratricopeptide repeat protein [Gammaproteobacteria bacterium]
MSPEQALIFEVSQQSFPSAVLSNSEKVPVLVLFMGPWSEHCFKMEHILTELAKEFPGLFIFAKVDIDEQQELRKQFKIVNVPTLIVFSKGQSQQTEEGVMQEDELRGLLKTYGLFHESDELREQARAKHLEGDTITAVKLLTEAIQKHPSNTRAAMDMVQIFLDLNELEQAESLLHRLPENDRQSDVGKVLQGQLTFRILAARTEGEDALVRRIEQNPDDFDASFDLAICRVAEFDYKHAIECLFNILEKKPDYKDGAAREMVSNL